MTLPITVRYVLAYGLVIVLVQFCSMLGTILVTMPVAGCLAWAPARLRGVVAGTCSGLGGVAAAVAFGYFVFRLILGPGAFTLLPLLASTVPLIIPILKDLAKSRLLHDDLTNIRHKFGRELGFGVDIAAGVRFRAVGYILGLTLTFAWFFFAHPILVIPAQGK
jgi:hypothetical protein